MIEINRYQRIIDIINEPYKGQLLPPKGGSMSAMTWATVDQEAKLQTLGERNTYTPQGVPQALCNCDSVLNRDPRYQDN